MACFSTLSSGATTNRKSKVMSLFSLRSYRPGRNRAPRRQRSLLLVCLVCGVLLASMPVWAQASQPEEPFEHPEHGSLAEVGAKLANPVSDVWALFTEFDLNFSDGDVNLGNPKIGGRMIFQPVMPIPLFGEAEEEWKLITRPIIPVLFSQPVPKGLDDFNHPAGVGDIQLPMLVSPPSGDWLLGVGPTWLFPSASRDAFGRDQWGVGPAAVVGYKTKNWTAGVFPQYTFGIGGWNDDDKPDASYLSMLYFFIYNLPDAWQVGLNPTISYDHKAPANNRWNVPLGLIVAKTTRIGNLPVKFQLGVEYSVVSQDAFGQRAQIKLNVIPVIPSLIKKPLLGMFGG